MAVSADFVHRILTDDPIAAYEPSPGPYRVTVNQSLSPEYDEKSAY